MHRIVRQLDAEGLLQREPNRRVYGPGPRLLNFALGTVRSSMRSAPRHAVLEALSAKVGETCNFGMMRGNAVLYLDRVEASWPFGLRSNRARACRCIAPRSASCCSACSRAGGATS